MKNLFLASLIIIACGFGFTSCGSDDGPAGCSVAWATDLQAELTAIQNASVAYSNDQSQANCDALKAAYLAYVNKLRPYGNCTGLTGQDRASWQQAIDEAEDNVSTIC